VVASLGTAFTDAQARLLARYATRVVFSFDGDAAGASATARSVDLLLEKGFEVRVAELPSDADPDDFIRRHGAEAYVQLVRRAPEFVQFLIDREARSRDIDRAEGKVAAVNAVLPHWRGCRARVERVTWAGRLADALHIDDDVILGELRAALKARQTRIRQPLAAATGEIRLAESRLVTLLLRGAASGASAARASIGATSTARAWLRSCARSSTSRRRPSASTTRRCSKRWPTTSRASCSRGSPSATSPTRVPAWASVSTPSGASASRARAGRCCARSGRPSRPRPASTAS